MGISWLKSSVCIKGNSQDKGASFNHYWGCTDGRQLVNCKLQLCNWAPSTQQHILQQLPVFPSTCTTPAPQFSKVHTVCLVLRHLQIWKYEPSVQSMPWISPSQVCCIAVISVNQITILPEGPCCFPSGRVLVVRERRGEHSLPGWLLSLGMSHPPSPSHWRLPISLVWVTESNLLLGHLSYIDDLMRGKGSWTFSVNQGAFKSSL